MLKVCCNAIENYSPFLNLLPLTRCSFHHLLFLEASVLNSYSLLKHRRWQSKKIPTNVWPFLFCQALSNWENYYCPTPQPNPDLQNFRQAKKIYMNLVFEIFLKYSFYCKNETSNLELKSWSTLCPYAPAEKLFSLVVCILQAWYTKLEPRLDPYLNGRL